MKKFVFVYYGSKKPGDMKPEEAKDVMAKWEAWYGSIGGDLADGGNPFAPGGQSITAKGAETIADDQWPSKGYTIINASDMKAAVEVAKGCPMLEDDPDGAVRVYEAMPM